ncbi:metalloregulator ArsR/SmtB family transcription factor [candidate division KSB1 bacterium]|nr:metalloregulator ArsR/SmtB family transcription factor [candidate division KSB1 bacterium]
MTHEQNLAILKALADDSRLSIVNALLDQDQCVEDLAQRLNLAASTVSFHLKKLENAELVTRTKRQYYVIYSINHEIFDLPLSTLLNVAETEQQIQSRRIEQSQQKVIDTFFTDGRLQKLPTQQKKRRIVLAYILGKIDDNHRYSEQELTEIIHQYYDDHCSIRREMIDFGWLQREHGVYWKDSDSAYFPRKNNLQIEETIRENKMSTDNKKQLKEQYKEMKIPKGILKIENTANGKVFLVATNNLLAAINRQRATLKLNSNRNVELQNDWNTFGAEQFTFEILDQLEESDDDSPARAAKELALLLEMWLDKLQPYEERGYHTPEKRNLIL